MMRGMRSAWRVWCGCTFVLPVVLPVVLSACRDTTAPGGRLSAVWSVPLGTGRSIDGAANSVPAADADMVIFSVAQGGEAVVVALDASTGGSRWARAIPGPSVGSYSDLVLTPTRVVRATPNQLTVLDRAGNILWDSTYPEVGGVSGMHVRGDTVLVATGRTVAAWQLSTGVRLWRQDYPVDSALVRLGGVTVSGDTVYASGTRFFSVGADKQGVILALRLGDGASLWRLEPPVPEFASFTSAASIAGSLLLLLDFGSGGVQAVDRFAPVRVWRTVGLPCCVGGIGSPIVDGSTLYYAGGDETVRALDVTTGRERWRAQSEGGFRAQAVACGGRIWATNFALRAYDLATGAPRGVALDGQEEYASSALATARGLVFVASQQRFNAFACN